MSLPSREFLVLLKKSRMFERTASANCCLDMYSASTVWTNLGVCQVQRLHPRAVETYKIPYLPTCTEHQQLFALLRILSFQIRTCDNGFIKGN